MGVGVYAYRVNPPRFPLQWFAPSREPLPFQSLTRERTPFYRRIPFQDGFDFYFLICLKSAALWKDEGPGEGNLSREPKGSFFPDALFITLVLP